MLQVYSDQLVLCDVLQEPLGLYKSSMTGARKHLAHHAHDGSDSFTFLSEATVNKGSGVIGSLNDKFEHLTCFAGAMFVLGKQHLNCVLVHRIM